MPVVAFYDDNNNKGILIKFLHGKNKNKNKKNKKRNRLLTDLLTYFAHGPPGWNAVSPVPNPTL